MTCKKEGAYHTPVLLKDCIEALQIRPDGTYVDVTFGGGGHSKEILKRLQNGRLFAFDCDPDASANRFDDPRFSLRPENFRNLRRTLNESGIDQVDGILADLGVSSHQFDVPERGFSTRFDAPLDMRMNPMENRPTASRILNTYTESQLRNLFSRYGELRNASSVAKAIVRAREKRMETVEDLKQATAHCAERGKENRFYAQVFQALRIEVNEELGSLKEFLIQSAGILKEGGRIAVIAYHSLEDRLVKNFFRSGKFEGEAEKDLYGNVETPFRPVNRQPIVPEQQEIDANSRARSAKLRIAERTRYDIR